MSWLVGCGAYELAGSVSDYSTTSWLHLESWNLPDSQLSWESKMEPECGNYWQHKLLANHCDGDRKWKERQKKTETEIQINWFLAAHMKQVDLFELRIRLWLFNLLSLQCTLFCTLGELPLFLKYGCFHAPSINASSTHSFTDMITDPLLTNLLTHLYFVRFICQILKKSLSI